MANQNDFLPFASTDTGSNLLSESAYLAASDRVNGNQPGVASSQLVNKALRQSSFITSQFAQWISNKLAQDVLDDANNAEFLAQLYASLAPNDSFAIENLGFTALVGSSSLSVALKTQAGSDPTTTDISYIGMRSATITTGNFIRRSITSALSLVVPSGATLGTVNSVASYLYLYAIDNAGTIELAIINGYIDQGSLHTTTAMTTGSDSAGVLYSSSTRASVAVRCIGRILITQSTAGAWTSSATELAVVPFGTTTSGADFLGTIMTSVGSNAISIQRTRATGAVVGVGDIGFGVSSGAFSTTNSSYLTVTGTGITQGTSGRPVLVSLIPDGTTGGGIGSFVSASNSNGSLQITRDTSAICTIPVFTATTPPGAYSFLDTNVAAGTHNYGIQVLNSTGGTISVFYCRLTTVEQ